MILFFNLIPCLVVLLIGCELGQTAINFKVGYVPMILILFSYDLTFKLLMWLFYNNRNKTTTKIKSMCILFLCLSVYHQ